MSARIVEYIVSLVDRYSAVANKIAESSTKAAGSANAFGAAVNRAESALAKLVPPPALAGLPGQFERAAAGANKMATAVNNANAAMSKTTAVVASRSGGSGGNTVVGGGGDKLGKGLMAWLAGDMALGAIDGAIQKAADVDTMLEKLRFGMGGDTAMVKKAYDQAFSLSGKYKNTTVAENLHIIDDLRANLPHKMQDIIEKDLEPFVKLHSFFKAWEGGKHSGNAKGALKDIGTAIRSGELLGNVSGDDLAKHAQNLAVARVVFGEKFNLHGYFTAQKAAATALSAADDTFKSIDFAALEQRLGAGAGTALATLQNKTVGGIMMRQGSAEAWRRLGLVNMKNVRLDKKGLIDPKSMVGKDWLRGGALWGSNPTDAIMTVLAPALGNVAGLQALAGMKSAWNSGDVDKLVAINKKIDRNKLTKELAGLGYDRNAVKQLTETILGAASLLRDRQQWKQVLRDFQNFQSYEQSKQAFSAQMDRLFQALTGRTAVPFITSQINSAANALGRLANLAKNNPLARFAINTGALGGAALVLGRILGLLTGIRRLGRITLAFAIAGAVWENWDKIVATWERMKEAFKDPIKVSMLFPGLPEWFQKFMKEGYEENQRDMDRMNGKPPPGATPPSGAPAQPESWWQRNAPNRWFGWGSGSPAGDQKVDVNVTAPKEITIKITGTVNGPVTGNANLPLSTNHSRGGTGATEVPGPAPTK